MIMAVADELYFNRNLIQAVKARPMLYDFRRKDYKDTALKEKMWTNISEETGRSQQECTSRWRQLRDRYVREKRSERNETPTGKPKRNWRYMPLMEFLSTYVVHRSSSLETSTLLECLLSTETEMQVSAKSPTDKGLSSPESCSVILKNENATDCPVSDSPETPQTPPPVTTFPQIMFTQSILHKSPIVPSTLPVTTSAQTVSLPLTCFSQKSTSPTCQQHHAPALPKKKKKFTEDDGTNDSVENAATVKCITDPDEMFCLSIVEYFKEIDKMQKLELRTRILTTIQHYLSEIKK